MAFQIFTLLLLPYSVLENIIFMDLPEMRFLRKTRYSVKNGRKY